MPTQSRLKCDFEKLRNPEVAGTFQATIGGKFAPLINLRNDDIDIKLRDDDTDIDNMITTYNTAAVTDKASEIHGKECPRKKPCVTRDVLDL